MPRATLKGNVNMNNNDFIIYLLAIFIKFMFILSISKYSCIDLSFTYINYIRISIYLRKSVIYFVMSSRILLGLIYFINLL